MNADTQQRSKGFFKRIFQRKDSRRLKDSESNRLKEKLNEVRKSRDELKRRKDELKLEVASLRQERNHLRDQLASPSTQEEEDQFLVRTAMRGIGFATDGDLAYCYRLFLNRPCTPDDLESWTQHPRKFHLAELTHRMISHPEFQARMARYAEPYKVELDEFHIFVREDDFLVGQFIATYKTWEPHVIAGLRRVLKKGSVLVDVGANIGYISLFAAQLVGPEGKVIACEPNPRNCDLLRKSMESNGFRNIDLQACAISDQEGTLTLHADRSSSLALLLPESADVPQLWQACYPKTQDESQSVNNQNLEFKVRAAPLDHLLAGESRIDVIKIDTDGHEPLVFKGMQEVLKKHRPALFFEFFPLGYKTFSGMTADGFLDDLQALDYEVFNLNAADPSTPQPKEEMMAYLAQAEGLSLDLMAIPREQLSALQSH